METIRLSQKTKEQLVWLKRQTGIKNWNVLCRWALCISLADMKPLVGVENVSDSNLEMTWKTFAGHHSSLYRALIAEWQRQVDPGGEIDLVECVRKHIHRGVHRLMLAKDQSLSALVKIV